MPATILGLPPSHLPLLLHLIIETPASLSFLLRPESQLPLLSSPSSFIPSSITSASSKSTKMTTTKITPKEATEARLILLNFGGLLLSVNLVILYLLLFLNPGPAKDEVVKGVTGCLSLYHVFPQYRALRRIGMGLDICMPDMGFPAPAGDEKKKEKKKEKKEEGLKEEEEDETQKTLGGPVVHFIVHMIVGGLMSAASFGLLGGH